MMVRRPNIWKYWTRGKNGSNKVISITDNLDFGKVIVTGHDGGDNVRAWLGIGETLAICHSILNDTFDKLFPSSYEGSMKITGRCVIYGGSASSALYGGKPESRIFLLEHVHDKDRDGNPRERYKLEVRVGEGRIGTNGTVQPLNQKNMISQYQFLPMNDAHIMAATVLMHIQAYANRYIDKMYSNEGELYPKGLCIKDCFETDGFNNK